MRLAPANRYPMLRNVGLTMALGVAAFELAGCGVVSDPTNQTVETRPIPAVLQDPSGTWNGKLAENGTRISLPGKTNVDVSCLKDGRYEVTIQAGIYSNDRIVVPLSDLHSSTSVPLSLDGLKPCADLNLVGTATPSPVQSR